MSYVKTNWQDSPSTSTPINANNLNKIEQGIYENSVGLESIIESGSNSNGNWIKYSDGTMICYGTTLLSDVSFTTLSTNLNVSGHQTQNFPISFINSPIVNVNCYTNYYSWVASVFSANDYMNYYIMNNGTVNTNVYVFWKAIGKWK